MQTTERLYSFASERGSRATPTAEIARLQVVPADILVQQGDRIPFRVRGLDAQHLVVADRLADVTWSGIPKDAGIEVRDDRLEVAQDATPSAFDLVATVHGSSATARVRVVARPPFREDFSGPDPLASWIHMTGRWEVVERDGERVLAKVLDNPIFQRSFGSIGHPSARDYTMSVDILTDGNRRIMSTAGVIHQRYQILLKGNHQSIEVSSNMELLKESVPFRWKAGRWYRLKTRVDAHDDGSSTVRARCWPRDEEEPTDWNIEVRHANGHAQGAPGIYGFVPQSRFRVYLDNLEVAPITASTGPG